MSCIVNKKFVFCINLFNTVHVLSLVLAVIASTADARRLTDLSYQSRQANNSHFIQEHPLVYLREALPPMPIRNDQADISSNEVSSKRSWKRDHLYIANKPLSPSRRHHESDYSSLSSSLLSRKAGTAATSFVSSSNNIPFRGHITNSQESFTRSSGGVMERNDDPTEANSQKLLQEPVQHSLPSYQGSFISFSLDDRNARPYVGPSQLPINNRFFQNLPHLLRTDVMLRTTGILRDFVNPFRRSSYSSQTIRNAVSSQNLVLATPQKVHKTKPTTKAQLSMSPFLISRSPATDPFYKIQRTHTSPESFVTQSLTSSHSKTPTPFNSKSYPPSTTPTFRTDLPKSSPVGPPGQTPFRLEALKAEIVKSPLSHNVPYTPPPKRIKPKPAAGTRRPTMINRITDMFSEDMPTDLRSSRHLCRTTGVCPYSLSWFENNFMRSLVKLAMAE